MIIVPTRVCNSNQCDYCSVLKEDQGKLYFKEGFQIEDFIERLVYLRTITGENEIRFFGGEPFLALSRIEEIVRRTTPLGFRTVINTNLSLFKKEHIEFLRQYQIKLIVSCNGDLLSHCPTR